ncbi:MAG: glycosyltransferase family 2 protein [Candidatus Omnitrophota bacterium]
MVETRAGSKCIRFMDGDGGNLRFEMADSLSIVLPMLNEEKNIGAVIVDVYEHIPSRIKPFEVIVVNDGSTDSSRLVVERLKPLFANLKVVSHKKNEGYGAALKTGIRSAVNDWVLILDADGQFRIGDLELLWEKRENYDFILGFREKRRDTLYRLIMGRLGNLLSVLLLKQSIRDIDCGFKLFRREDVQALRLRSNGGAISFEILYRLLKNNKKRFFQNPVSHYPRIHGKSTGGRLKTIIKMIREAFGTIFGK